MNDIRKIYKVALISSTPQRTSLSCYVAARNADEAKKMIVDTYKIHPINAKKITVEEFDCRSSMILSDMFVKKYSKKKRGSYRQLTPDVTKSITLEYMSGLLGYSDSVSQSYISAKYQCSQGTVNRAIRNTSMRYTGMFIQDLTDGLTFNDIASKYDFEKQEYVKMTMLYALQKITSNDASYYDLAKQYGIIEFAQTLAGTAANRYAV